MMFFFVVLAAAISFIVSSWLIHRVEKFGLIDVPNTRSSHTKPTPKGGGFGIAAGILVACAGCFWGGLIGPDRERCLVIVGGALAMAVLGFFSDRQDIPAGMRLLMQMIVASVAVFFIQPANHFLIAGWDIHVGPWGFLIALIWLVGMTNFYNFMDGIDGLAAMQGIIAGIGIAMLGLIIHLNNLVFLGLILSAATTGFLFLNFPRAKIFMGDVGSYQIGMYIASVALIDQALFIPVVLMLGGFIFDTVVTLIRRAIRRERLHQAHKSHFYQRAVQLGYTHCQVTTVASFVFIILVILSALYLGSSPAIKVVIMVAVLVGLGGIAGWISHQETCRQRGGQRSV